MTTDHNPYADDSAVGGTAARSQRRIIAPQSPDCGDSRCSVVHSLVRDFCFRRLGVPAFRIYPNPCSLVLLPLVAVGMCSGALLADELSTAQPTPREMAEELGIELPALPWHVANVWWHLESEVEDFESLRVAVTIDRDVPETVNLYVAPVGVALINGLQFYGGLQTNINGWESRESRTRVGRGRGGIFSRWSHDKKTPIGLDHVREGGPDCLVESAGYEGEFASVRRPLAWTRGTWIYEVRKDGAEEIDGAKHTWFECRIRNPQGEWHPIGKLRFEGERFTFWNRHSAFVEVYATTQIPRSGIPKVNVTFGRPEINGKPAAITRASAHYPNSGSQAAPDCAMIVADGSDVRVEVGPIFRRPEEQRSHPLSP